MKKDVIYIDAIFSILDGGSNSKIDAIQAPRFLGPLTDILWHLWEKVVRNFEHLLYVNAQNNYVLNWKKWLKNKMCDLTKYKHILLHQKDKILKYHWKN